MSTYDYNTYSTVDSSAVGAVVGGVFLVVVIVLLIALVIALCAVIGQWKAFKKAGKGGWEAIIPIYNSVVLCQVSGVNPWWVLIVFLGSFVLNLIPVIGQLASFALTIYFSVLLYVSTARSFGKSDGFAAGLYFLGPIFWLILGGKNTQYVGPKPMNDVVMNFVNEKILNKQPQNSNVNVNNGFNSTDVQNNSVQPAVKFCTGCGYKITNNERFCPGCGKEVQ